LKPLRKLAAVTAVLALAATPAFAQAPNGHGNGNANGNANSHKPDNTPGPKASLPAKAKAYGHYCQNESKKHVAGTPGTPFSKCVTAMAKLANGLADNPTTACKGESKKHVAGTPGTPFSNCVKAGAKLQNDQNS
jgi:hypothetical protein